MKKHARAITTLASASVLAAAAFAAGCGGQNATNTGSQPLTAGPGAQASATAGPQGRHDPARMVARFDQNQNGQLEVSELPAPMQARMGTAADTNHDGVLAPEEMTAFHEARRAERFARMDSNSDGAITAAEAGEQRWARFAIADADHDGRVTRPELEQAFASGAMRGAHGGGGGFGGRFGGGGGGFHGGFRHGPPDPARFVSRFDQNGNGQLEVSELPAPMQARLGATADANHDGVISTDELTAAMQQHRGEHEPPAQQ